MQKKFLIRLVVYGIVQWIILNVVLFVVSLIYGIVQKTEMGAPPALGFVVLAVVLAGVSYLFVQLLHPSNRQQAIMAGVVWSGMTIIFMAVLTIANGTQGIIFGNWGIYTVFMSQIVGTLFFKNAAPTQPITTR